MAIRFLSLSPMLAVTPVFAKSCLRGEGCTDAGRQPEPHHNFPPMAFYRAAPDARPKPEPVQRAQAAKKTTGPVAEQRSWYQKLFTPEPETPQPAEAPPAQATAFLPGVPLLYAGGATSTLGSWLLRVASAAGQYATSAIEADATSSLTRILLSGPGAPLAAVAVGMFPGKLNAGEQDFIDKMRLAQIAERYGTAPTRVRFQWQKQADGRLMPVGYHTEQGYGADQVPVRMMALNAQTGYYEFTTDGPRPITILWTPESIEIDVPGHTGNEDPLNLPDTITVLPIPNQAGWIEHYPAPEERGFRDYILILPLPDIPPIYIYLSTDHKYHTPPKGNPPLPAFPDARKAQAKTPVQGGGKMRNRWKDSQGKIYEWDSQHGTVEVYDRSGRNHLGEFNPISGEQTKPANPARKVEK